MATLPPDALICPITNERLVDPVVDPEGNTYERAAILEWLSHNSVSPLTRTPLAAWQLVPNRTLADLLASTGDGTAGAAAVPPTPVQEAPSFELKLDVTHEAAGSTAAVHLEAASDCVSRTHSGRTIVCVLDISYSMDDRATMYGDAEGANGLSLLDIVKHATHTVIDTLEPHDRLGVVVRTPWNTRSNHHARLRATPARLPFTSQPKHLAPASSSHPNLHSIFPLVRRATRAVSAHVPPTKHPSR